jgi:chloramphenicol 3-O phosphotransferase
VVAVTVSVAKYAAGVVVDGTRRSSRERDRGDRPLGLARSQSLVYGHGEFDIAVDTTDTAPGRLRDGDRPDLGRRRPAPKAFDRLRRRTD